MRIFLYVAGLVFVNSLWPSEPRADAVTVIMDKAQRQNLAADPVWLRLGHWRQVRDRILPSHVDDPQFFLAPDGKSNPRAELAATLAAAFAQPISSGDNRHAICRFPARLRWLQQQLQFDPTLLPSVECPALSRFLERANPASISLIFSSYYIQDPASAFGHTLLRLNRVEDSPKARQELLDVGVSYAAKAGDENALVYGIKGLTGLYRGEFNFMTYYFKVREYADYESRDLWEYELNLNDEQLTRVVLHLWELGHVYFDYWFLTENCSYLLLSAIEVADSGFQLKQHIWPLVIPGETIKAVKRQAGLVRRVTYRPSLAKQFSERWAVVPRSQRDLVEAWASGLNPDISALSVTEQARILDASADLVDLRHKEDLIFYNPLSLGAIRKQAILSRRASLGFASPPLTVPTPWQQEPTLTHGAVRAGLLGGYKASVGPIASLEFRYAFHDWADRPMGYPEYGQVDFLSARLDVPLNGKLPRLQRFTFLDVGAINPWTAHHKGISWRATLGAERSDDLRCAGCFAFLADMSAGAAVAGHDDRMMLALLWGGEVRAAETMAGIAGRNLRLSATGTALLRIKLSENFLLLTSPSLHYAPYQAAELSFTPKTVLRWLPKERIALNVDAESFRWRYTLRGGLYFYM